MGLLKSGFTIAKKIQPKQKQFVKPSCWNMEPVYGADDGFRDG